eukprot:m.10736 g.10736  ORF g.10736 m.10736 type:complete len:276 (+) comp8457_c0_seq1:136-963(+)
MSKTRLSSLSSLSWMRKETVEYLESFPKGSKIGIMVLAGSLNPVTLSHVAMLVEGRRLLLDPSTHQHHPARKCDAVIAVVHCNADSWISRKLNKEQQYLALPQRDRVKLINLAVRNHPWITPYSYDDSLLIPDVKTFVYYINGADDVLKYEKWVSISHRTHRRYESQGLITVGRPGHTEAVKRAAEEHVLEEIDLIQYKSRTFESAQRDVLNFKRLFADSFLIGKEMADISSTGARAAAERGDFADLSTMLHPDVAQFMLEHVAKHKSDTKSSCS